MRIFEKHPHADAYRFGPSFTPYAIVAVDKRFTDAELAAEWHYALSEAETWFWVNHEQNDDRLEEQADTMRRFATLPHYDEVTA